MKLQKINWCWILILPLFIACGGEDDYTPKPRGYFRINLPEQEYTDLKSDCPFTFEYNENAQWQPKENCWGDIYYASLNARLQLTYKDVQKESLEKLMEDGRSLAYKHTVKADGIHEKIYTNEESGVYGILYRIRGEAASNTQFFMTDSTNHFIRGVLYFYAEPNADSLRPVNEYMYDEVVHLIETLEWQNS